ncbi:MAG: cupin domain-containing protein [Betaproteobacteria bacterium]|nr:cupin domain-containing protein [Betaproteobacteria bacterium]
MRGQGAAFLEPARGAVNESGPAPSSVHVRDVLPERAPDGSRVHPLGRTPHGSMARFELPAGALSRAVVHASADEIWVVVSGRGRMWRDDGRIEIWTDLEPELCVTIPRGTRFQFRCEGDEPLVAYGITMPPWSGDGDAEVVIGPWDPQFQGNDRQEAQSGPATPGPSP